MILTFIDGSTLVMKHYSTLELASNPKKTIQLKDVSRHELTKIFSEVIENDAYFILCDDAKGRNTIIQTDKIVSIELFD